MSELRIIYFLLFVYFISFSCSKNTTSIINEEKQLIPLNTGNSWIFKKSYFNSNMELVKTENDSFIISSDTLISGEVWYCQNYLGHRIAYLNSYLGISARLVSPNTPDDIYLQYKYPAKVGTSFSYPQVWFSGDKAWFDDSKAVTTVIRVDTLITIPVGSFKCYQYRIKSVESHNSYTDEFICPEYGWIKKEIYMNTENGNYIFCVFELTELLVN